MHSDLQVPEIPQAVAWHSPLPALHAKSCSKASQALCSPAAFAGRSQTSLQWFHEAEWLFPDEMHIMCLIFV